PGLPIPAGSSPSRDAERGARRPVRYTMPVLLSGGDNAAPATRGNRTLPRACSRRPACRGILGNHDPHVPRRADAAALHGRHLLVLGPGARGIDRARHVLLLRRVRGTGASLRARSRRRRPFLTAGWRLRLPPTSVRPAGESRDPRGASFSVFAPV